MTRLTNSLRFRLLLLVLFSFVPAIGLVLFTAQEQRRSSAVQAEEHALQLARAAASTQEDLVESTSQFLDVVAQLPAIRGSDPLACAALLAQLLERYPRYTSITVRAWDGSPRCRATPTEGPVPREPVGPAFARAWEAHALAIGDFEIGRTSGKATLGFGYPILDDVGQFQGVIVAALDLATLTVLAPEAILPPGSTLMAIDTNGVFLAHYPEPEKWVGKSAPNAPIIQAILSQAIEGTVEAAGEDDVTRLYAFVPWRIGTGNRVYVSVGIPSAVAFEQANQTLTRNLLTLGLVAVLVLGAAWIGSEWFVIRQVSTLLRVTGRLASGDLQARAGLRSGVGELAQLAGAFDTMAQALEQREGARQQAEDQTRRWCTRMQALMNAVGEAISQSLPVNEIADIALSQTLSLMDLTSGCVLLKQGDSMVLVAQRGLAQELLPRIQRLAAGPVAETSAPEPVRATGVQIRPVEVLPGAEWLRDEGIVGLVSVPIESKSRVFGIICLGTHEPRELEAHVQGVLAAVGRQVGVAIENAELQEQVQSMAAVRERERLSHELHDGLAQVLGYLCHRTVVTRDLVRANQTERVAVELQEMQQVVQEAHQDLRESVLGLRATVSPRGGMLAALKEYAHKFGLQTGIRATLVVAGCEQLQYSPEAEVQLLRIIQESLANVRKHSGARQAWIRFECENDAVTVTIQDDGSGFDPAAPHRGGLSHFGLQTMRERAEGVGGSFRVSSELGHGTKVSVRLPVCGEANR